MGRPPHALAEATEAATAAVRRMAVTPMHGYEPDVLIFSAGLWRRAMVDVAHEASGPALPKPGDIALQQASRPDSPDRGKLRVFISYSRDDLDFADQLDAALNAYGFECIIDRQGISGGEDWKRRLGNLISEADTVAFVLSPTSARSEICAWEVEEAARLSKRILPVNCRPLKGASPPPRLRNLNYIFFHADLKAPGSGFGTGLAKLVAALNTDLDWLREHTRYLQRATELTGVAGQRTGCCQATILPRQRLGLRAAPRMRPSLQPYTSTSFARVKRRQRRERVPNASSSRRWPQPRPSGRRPCMKPKRP